MPEAAPRNAPARKKEPGTVAVRLPVRDRASQVVGTGTLVHTTDSSLDRADRSAGKAAVVAVGKAVVDKVAGYLTTMLPLDQLQKSLAGSPWQAYLTGQWPR